MKKIKENFSISSILLILIGIFPLGIGAFTAAKNYSLHKNPYPFIIILLAFLAIGFLLPSSIKLKPTFKGIITLSIFLLAMASRYLSIIALQTTPTSDFGWVLINAPKFIGQTYPNQYSINNPHWGLYTLTISEIFKILPPSLTSIQFFNVILAGFSAVGICLLGKNIFDSEKIGLLSSIIYIFYPADLLYKSLPTGDHIFIAILPYIFLLFHKALQSDLKSRRYPFLFLSIGLLIGFIDLYKPVGIVLIIAMAITIILWVPKISINQVIRLISIPIILIGFVSIQNLGSSILENRTGLRLQQSYLFRSIRIGTDIQNNGMWNDQTSRQINKIIAENDNVTAKQILFHEILTNLSASGSDLKSFFFTKFYYVWKSDFDFFYWTANNRVSGVTTNVHDFIQNHLLNYVDAFHFFILIFSSLGLFFAGFIKKINLTFFAMSLFIFGFALLLLFSEIQQRYRSIIFPVLPILASYCISTFYVMLNKFKIKVAKNRE